MELWTYICAALDALAEKIEAMGAIIASSAFVKRCEVNGMLQGTVLNETAFGNVFIIFGKAHNEAQADFGVGV